MQAKSVFSKLAIFLLATILVVGGGFMALDVVGRGISSDELTLEDAVTNEPTMDSEITNELPLENNFADNSSLEKDIRISRGVEAFQALIQELTKDGVCVYPDDYAGAYFDDDGYLIILTTKENFDDISFKSTNPLIAGNTTYKYAQYSYNTLKAVQAFLGRDYMFELGVNFIAVLDNLNIVQFGLSDLQNKDIVLTLLRDGFSGFDESMVTFIQQNRAVTLPLILDIS